MTPARTAELVQSQSDISLVYSVIYVTKSAFAAAVRGAYIGVLTERLKGKATVIPITGLTP